MNSRQRRKADAARYNTQWSARENRKDELVKSGLHPYDIYLILKREYPELVPKIIRSPKKQKL